MPELRQHLQRQLYSVQTTHLARRFVVALSGGLDSSVLLHALAELKSSGEIDAEIVALHINHQLSDHADSWQQQAQQFSENLNVRCLAERVSVKPSGRGLEDAAREARYGVFERVLEPADVLLMAHHSDDQVETMLLRLMRGAGVSGLAGIRKERALGDGLLYRPLLELSRQDLHGYAVEHELSWIEDESNADTRFDRNYLRAEVLPKLAARWPGFQSRWQQSATFCSEQSQHQQQELERLFEHSDLRQERLGCSILRSSLAAHPPHLQLSLLRFWLQRIAASADLAALKQIQQQLLLGREDSTAQVQLRGAQGVYQSVRGFGGRLYAIGELPKPPKVGQTLPVRASSRVSDCSDAVTAVVELPLGVMSLQLTRSSGSRLAQALTQEAEQGRVEVRFRSGGERCQPEGRGHSQTLKKLLLEYRLEPWLRPYIPLLYINGELAAAVGLWACAGFCESTSEASLQLEWLLTD